ncbi:response regulator [Occallatibacter savannae]|uniref:response regulator n=1 Tax=Occallatibacter savannae TaxID=1002691 RepID=UPI000D69530B|nr:response regulator [Occallatibacter savannae]
MTKQRVLVLDDEALIADSLVQILEMFGFDAAACYDPADAVAWLSANPCDILVSDVVFNGQMSGVDLAIQMCKTMPRCKVLLMSGNNSTGELLAAAQEQGHTFDILAKPVHPSVILERLRAISNVHGPVA